jgi:hypothetical protein
MDKIFNETFKYAKRLAKDFYFNTWAKKPPQCPAFKNEKINIGHEGWNHTVTTIRRTKMDVLGRMFCLERAKYLLENSITFQDQRKIRDMEFWIFESVVEDVKVKVIVRSIGGGTKHFYSVIRKGLVEDEIEDE